MEEESSINSQNVIKVADRLEENVDKLGHWVGMYNTEPMNASSIFWTLASSTEKKFVTGNCYVERAKHREK